MIEGRERGERPDRNRAGTPTTATLLKGNEEGRNGKCNAKCQSSKKPTSSSPSDDEDGSHNLQQRGREEYHRREMVYPLCGRVG